jgi:hypothetical protein
MSTAGGIAASLIPTTTDLPNAPICLCACVHRVSVVFGGRSLSPPASVAGIVSKHPWKCGNPVRIGDGSATVSGHKPPGRKTATGPKGLGRRGRGIRPGVRISRQGCSSRSGSTRILAGFAAQRRMRPAGHAVRALVRECHAPSFSVGRGGRRIVFFGAVLRLPTLRPSPWSRSLDPPPFRPKQREVCR